ncbi:metal-dependent hydrolase [Syntrophotalea carbinolica DSM 2380]|uniref:Metal-dependent hydrolase n=1 Tax=Syntrophotalea carbinolica (strain DSM 2380 / NBRC 103641 / GraBd1) TaxID=338963 RepID=Q3A8M1_SYNC1|nr:endonuclease/exonuclease/phosphatase family protein [Syntrophotalea carbinolica]ABA87271.1 metal-dependent hydrolase [Syntrophotalea carbinolica DSM 2380]
MYTIRIMTYNIHGCRGTDGRTDPARILEVISRAGPDMVALQEVAGSLDNDQAAWLGQRLAMNYYGPDSPGGNAFLSYYPMRAMRYLDLEGGSCLCADINIAGRCLHIFNIRLHEHFRQRRRQWVRLFDPQDGVGSHSTGCPVMLLGDFGDGPWSLRHGSIAPALRLAKSPFWSSTFPSWLPLCSRDRAYLGGQLRIVDSRIYRYATARRASTHLPLLFTVRVADPRNYLQAKGVKHGRMEIAPG